MKSANAFYGHYLSLPQQFGSHADRIGSGNSLPVPRHQRYGRTTVGTARGLGMETPIKRVAIFGLAAGAQGKIPHCCQGTVIGRFFN